MTVAPHHSLNQQAVIVCGASEAFTITHFLDFTITSDNTRDLIIGKRVKSDAVSNWN